MNRRFLLKTAALAAVPSLKLDAATGVNPNAQVLQACIVEKGGVLKIEINGQVFEPLAFRSFRPEERNIREFYGRRSHRAAAGIRVRRPRTPA